MQIGPGSLPPGITTATSQAAAALALSSCAETIGMLRSTSATPAPSEAASTSIDGRAAYPTADILLFRPRVSIVGLHPSRSAPTMHPNHPMPFRQAQGVMPPRHHSHIPTNERRRGRPRITRMKNRFSKPSNIRDVRAIRGSNSRSGRTSHGLSRPSLAQAGLGPLT